MVTLSVGDFVRRVCPGTIGHNSIGYIYEVSDTCYWVKITEGAGRMEGWDTDAWSKSWCVPTTPQRKPAWEV